MLFRPIAYAVAAAALLTAAPAFAQLPGATQVPAQVKAGSYVLDASHGKISWSVKHMGFSTYVGQFTGVAATLDIDPAKAADAKLDVTIDTNSVGTLNAKLDDHLKKPDFLDTAKYPTATFKSTALKLTGERTADVTGDLTLHGVTKPVVMKVTFNQAGVAPTDKKYTLGFDGIATIKRSEFGITTYVPMISDEVTLYLEAEFKAVP